MLENDQAARFYAPSYLQSMGIRSVQSSSDGKSGGLPQADESRLMITVIGRPRIETLPLYAGICRALCSGSCARSHHGCSVSESILFQSRPAHTKPYRQLHDEEACKVVIAFHQKTTVHVGLTTQCRCICSKFVGSTTCYCCSLCHGRPCGILQHYGHD